MWIKLSHEEKKGVIAFVLVGEIYFYIIAGGIDYGR